MRAFVFTDPALASEAGRFVWLAIDVEKAKNEKARKAYPSAALPTFFLLDPADGSVVRRWVGGMTVAQLKAFLRQGEAAVAATHASGSPPAGDALARADHAYGAGDYAAAAVAYDSVFAAPPRALSTPAEYARIAEAALFANSMAERNEAGLALAESALIRAGRTTTGASAAAQGLSFALALPDTVPGRAARIARFEAATRGFLADPSVALADDDRSGLLATLMEARQDAKDEAGAKQAAADWAAFLEGAAARAKTAEQRAVFDSHRLSAYLELGAPERAVPMLVQSERALPGDYNPPYRLAVAYIALKRLDDALAAEGLRPAQDPHLLDARRCPRRQGRHRRGQGDDGRGDRVRPLPARGPGVGGDHQVAGEEARWPGGRSGELITFCKGGRKREGRPPAGTAPSSSIAADAGLLDHELLLARRSRVAEDLDRVLALRPRGRLHDVELGLGRSGRRQVLRVVGDLLPVLEHPQGAERDRARAAFGGDRDVDRVARAEHRGRGGDLLFPIEPLAQVHGQDPERRRLRRLGNRGRLLLLLAAGGHGQDEKREDGKTGRRAAHHAHSLHG